MSLSYAIVGDGRMGRSIDAAAAARGHERVAIARGADELGAVVAARPAVAFEFTRPDAAPDNVRRLAAAGVDVVCGTTGWAPDDAVRDAVAAGGGALVVEPNFSIGVLLFARVVRDAARLAARLDTHDPAIVEWHHRAKRDAPSGTARHLARLVRSVDPRVTALEHGRADGPTPPGTMHVSAIRVGHEPGRHQLVLDGPHDRIVLEHAARSRDGFALGAVRAAEWIRGRRGIVSLDELIEQRLGSEPGPADGG